MSEINKEPGLANVYNKLLIPGANMLSRVEQNGILIDPFFLGDLDVKYQAEIAKILREVQALVSSFWDPYLYMDQTGHKTAPDVFNPGSPDQMAWLNSIELKLKPRVRRRSTDQKVLTSFDCN